MRLPIDKRLVVGIAGGTGSGKSTVGRRIIEAVGEDRISYLDQDSYYRDLSHLTPDERRGRNFDHPDAIEFPLLAAHVDELKAGRTAQKPLYSFKESTRTGETVPVNSADIIIVEGILVLWDRSIRSTLDVKLFVDADDDIRFIRRLTRDLEDRGRSLDQVVTQYQKTVRPMHQAFVDPSKRYADVIIPGGGNNHVAIAMVSATLRDWVQARMEDRQAELPLSN